MNKHFCFELCSSFLMEKSTPADAKGESCIFFGFLIIFWIEDLKKRGGTWNVPPRPRDHGIHRDAWQSGSAKGLGDFIRAGSGALLDHEIIDDQR